MITIHILVKDAARAAAWYGAVFDAQELGRITLPDGRLIDLVLSFGGSRVVLADEFPEHGALSPKSTGQSSAVFYLQVDDVDARCARAVAEGAEVIRPVMDWFTGERDGQVVDPFGHRWGLTQHVRDVPRDEVAREAARFFGGAPSAAPRS